MRDDGSRLDPHDFGKLLAAFALAEGLDLADSYLAAVTATARYSVAQFRAVMDSKGPDIQALFLASKAGNLPRH